MKMKNFITGIYLSIVILIIAFWVDRSQAQVLFEGYSKITLAGNFIGFTVQRYEYDTAKKNFISTSLNKYNEVAGNITESLKAYSNEALEPVSYVYNYIEPKKTKTIEAQVEKGKTNLKLKLKITENGKTINKERDLPKGTFFSSFLAYVILKNPQGLKTSTNYDYQAVAEEDGEIYKGSAEVKSEETYKNLHVFKIVNTYKEAQFVSLTTEKGEMLYTTAPQKELALELATEPASAMGTLTVSAENLKLLFGSIPEGKVNALVSAPPATGVTIKKPEAVKGLEVQTPPAPNELGKKGTRKNLQIQTKPK